MILEMVMMVVVVVKRKREPQQSRGKNKLCGVFIFPFWGTTLEPSPCFKWVLILCGVFRKISRLKKKLIRSVKGKPRRPQKRYAKENKTIVYSVSLHPLFFLVGVLIRSKRI